MRRIIIIISCLMFTGPGAWADDKEKTMFAAAPAPAPAWGQTTLAMAPEAYSDAIDRNRGILRDRMAVWAQHKLADHENLGPALGAVGTTLDLAMRDQRYNLNTSGTMGLLLRDSARSRRALLIEYRTRW